ncbi:MULTISPECIES: 30S ribosomal protein S18 [unclassified Gordonia (in: high G+C Gram-positive bacteria)]|uniref:30S ribosomal protein S18 n=2 Tax=Gordonia TaxID=2053 RepID=UPI001FFF551A|nr:30S ribosomal protein S18 [Gordonia sp. PP30]UQE75601.1 30S ribosomal protein S18 [Gordonia sp. PP30]
MARRKPAGSKSAARKRPPKKADPALVFDYKDTASLRRFLSDKGRIRSRQVTGLSPQQQRQLATAVRNAREMALLPYGPS